MARRSSKTTCDVLLTKVHSKSSNIKFSTNLPISFHCTSVANVHKCIGCPEFKDVIPPWSMVKSVNSETTFAQSRSVMVSRTSVAKVKPWS